MHNVEQYLLTDGEEEDAIEYGEEYIDGEIEIEEPPEELPKKRRVVGRIPRRNVYSPPVDREDPDLRDVSIMSPSIPTPAQFFSGGGSSYYPSPQAPRKSPAEVAREQVQIDILYQRELAKAQQREAMRNRPRASTSKKFLKVANEYASGDNGTQRVNQGLSCLFLKPKVDLPTNNPVKKNIAQKWNKVIADVRPKATSQNLGKVNIKKKKSR